MKDLFEGMMEDEVSVDCADIPYFPIPRVSSHGKQMVFGRVSGKRVILLSGRVHLYEGHSSQKLNYGTYLLAFLGCKYLITTQAAGGGIVGMKPGSMMIARILCPMSE